MDKNDYDVLSDHNPRLFGQIIKTARQRHNLTQVKLAKKAKLSATALRKIEDGKIVVIQIETMIRLFNALKVKEKPSMFDNMIGLSRQVLINLDDLNDDNKEQLSDLLYSVYYDED